MLQVDDHVHVTAHPEDRPFIQPMFRRAGGGVGFADAL